MATAEKLGEFEVRPGVTYATHDSVALAGDLYLPKGAGPFPALIGVHGGGWVQGARGQFQHWGKYLAERGIALFAISYRFAKRGQKTFPEAVQDVLAGIQFIRGNAKEFNIAPDRIGVFGHSAGGNLGALAALGGSRFANGYPQDQHAKVSTGAAGSMPIPGCRNRIGRPEPSSTASMVTPFTTSDLIASGMRKPLVFKAPLSIARAKAVFQDHATTRVQRKGTSGWLRPKN